MLRAQHHNRDGHTGNDGVGKVPRFAKLLLALPQLVDIQGADPIGEPLVKGLEKSYLERRLNTARGQLLGYRVFPYFMMQ